MMIDWFTVLMFIIIAFIGGFICIYTVGYMKGYHKHHNRCCRPSAVFLFNAVFIFGSHVRTCIVSEFDLDVFFWEITSVISFLMIGYDTVLKKL